MREIKFRGLCPITNKLVYGALDNRHNVPRILSFQNEEEWTQVFDESVGEYTGLKDKNGKEIYEGDVISYNSRITRIEIEEVLQVAQINREHGRSYFGRNQAKECSLLGNIYENPELLENV